MDTMTPVVVILGDEPDARRGSERNGDSQLGGWCGCPPGKVRSNVRRA